MRVKRGAKEEQEVRSFSLDMNMKSVFSLWPLLFQEVLESKEKSVQELKTSYASFLFSFFVTRKAKWDGMFEQGDDFLMLFCQFFYFLPSIHVMTNAKQFIVEYTCSYLRIPQKYLVLWEYWRDVVVNALGIFRPTDPMLIILLETYFWWIVTTTRSSQVNNKELTGRRSYTSNSTDKFIKSK